MNLHSKILNSSSFSTNLERAISEGFTSTDSEFCEMAVKMEDQSGATATCAFIVGNTLTVGNVGDSSAFLCRANSQPLQLTVEHKASREEEKQRVKDNGGLVVWFSGGWRVNGIVAVSRSIGDEPLAKFVVATPDVVSCELKDDDQFLVLASDGLWDVMSIEEVIEFVSNWQKDSRGISNVCEALADEARRRDSQDDITVVIIFLNAKGFGRRADKLTFIRKDN